MSRRPAQAVAAAGAGAAALVYGHKGAFSKSPGEHQTVRERDGYIIFRSVNSLEPWLSSCRAVEAPSSCCRGLACRACRGLLRLTPCACASRSVELSSTREAVELCRVSVYELFSVEAVELYLSSVLSSSSLACSFAILHEQAL